MEPASSSYAESDGGSDSQSRSRASSVVSTGTKVSVGTMGTFLTSNTGIQPMTPLSLVDQQTTSGNSIDVLLGRRNFRISARPGSVLSISSFDHPAPPYHEAIRHPAIPIDFAWHQEPISPLSHRTADNREIEATGEDHRAGGERRPSPSVRIDHPGGSEEEESDESEVDGDDMPMSPTTPSMIPFSSEQPEAARNALSRYYTEIVRQIDTNHQNAMAQLQATHAAELRAQLSAQRTELEVAFETQLDDTLAEERSQHDSALAAQRNDIDATYRTTFASMRNRETSLEVQVARAGETVAELTSRIEALQASMKQQRDEAEALQSQLSQRDIEAAALRLAADERERLAVYRTEEVWEAQWRQSKDLAAQQTRRAAAARQRRLEDLISQKWGHDAMLEIRRQVSEQIGSQGKGQGRGRKDGNNDDEDGGSGGGSGDGSEDNLSDILAVDKDALPPRPATATAATGSGTLAAPVITTPIRKKLWPSFSSQ